MVQTPMNPDKSGLWPYLETAQDVHLIVPGAKIPINYIRTLVYTKCQA